MRADHRPVIKKTGFFIYFGITAAVREMLLCLRGLPQRFHQVRLNADAVFCAELSESRKELTAAGRGKPGCKDRLCGAVCAVLFQEHLCFPDRILCRFAEVFRAVGIHVHLADVGIKAFLFHPADQVSGSLPVYRAEYGGMHRAVQDHVVYESVIDSPGKFHVREPRFQRESIFMQPVIQKLIHCQSALRILRRMHMEIGKRRDDDPVPEIRHRRAA